MKPIILINVITTFSLMILTSAARLSQAEAEAFCGDLGVTVSSSSDKPVCFRLVETRNPGSRTSCGCIQNGEVLDLVTLWKKLTRSTIGSQQAK